MPENEYETWLEKVRECSFEVGDGRALMEPWAVDAGIPLSVLFRARDEGVITALFRPWSGEELRAYLAS